MNSISYVISSYFTWSRKFHLTSAVKESSEKTKNISTFKRTARLLRFTIKL